MGKGPKGEQKESIEKYGDPGYQQSQQMAGTGRNIYYGSGGGQRGYGTTPSYQQPTRQRAQPSQMYQDQWGNKYWEPRDTSGRMQGRDRAHEIYRWGMQTGQTPQAMMAKDLYGGDPAYLQWLIDQGDGKDSVAYQGWKGLPNELDKSYFAGGRNLQPLGGGGGQGVRSDQEYQDIMQNLIGGRPLTTETMKDIEPQLSQYGLRFTWNATGERPDLVLPDGRQIDFVHKMGGAPGEQYFQWENVPITRAMRESGFGGFGDPSGHMWGVGPGGDVAGGAISDYGTIMPGFAEFAQTGGFSPTDLAMIRARAVSPVRAMHERAKSEMDRQRTLQGGYSPGHEARLGRLARQMGQAGSDAATNAEAAIAQMVQQGRLAGLGGMAGMYGTTPGLANMFGQQALASQGMANQMGLGMIGAHGQAAMMPTGFQAVMGNIGRGAGMALPFVTGGAQFTNPFSGGGAA